MDAEVKVSSVEIPVLTNVLPLNPEVGQKIAIHALPIPGPFVLIFSNSYPYSVTALVLAHHL